MFYCLVFVMPSCASVHLCLVVTCWKRAGLLAVVCGVYCENVTFPLVSWVRCGTLLYRFLIFAPLLTLISLQDGICLQNFIGGSKPILSHPSTSRLS